MTALELRASLGLAGIYALRMLGMFLILPVFALYAETLRGADNHTLIGIALGSYGLVQALLQLPLGMLSDKVGRKKIIYGGLLLFAAGSFIDMSRYSSDEEAIDAILAAHGVDMARAKAAIAAPDTTRHIADIHTTAAALRLRGTPTFFVNGKASPGIDPAEIGKLIEAAKR